MRARYIQRLSIYDTPETSKQQSLAPAHPTLVEQQLRTTRHAVSAHFATTRATMNEYTNQYFALEQKARLAVSPLYTPQEPLLPNALYVTLATFGGLVATANSQRVLVRVGGPAALGVAAAAWWFPITGAKLGTALFGDVDLGVRDSFQAASNSVSSGFSSIQSSISDATKSAREAVDQTIGSRK
ncbi:hypothetical protein HDU78_002472 [Chytriomyces hyalinus]|nr:hypothetical protein HDU78_002472 [Chytriomyces hyalinus]KAJ3256654.1 hypothetical protein HDU77_003002 [Chytriomyces hyalinus]